MDEVRIESYRPGAIGRITELHAAYYSEFSGFGLFFEAKVASEMSEFMMRFDNEYDGFWLAVKGDEIIGSVAIDGAERKTKGAHLRWYIVDPKSQGSGIGSALMQKAVDFCKQKKFKRVYLWTFKGLDAARHLYEKYGFTLSKEQEGGQWGVVVKEQMFELELGTVPNF